jgi:hypothetical protein
MMAAGFVIGTTGTTKDPLPSKEDRTNKSTFHARMVKIFKHTVSLRFTTSSLTTLELEFQPDMAHTEAQV